MSAPLPMVSIDPLDWLGDRASALSADALTSMMMGLWSAGMWLLEMSFKMLDGFVTPNIADPDLRHLYSVTVWVSLAVALVIGFGQIGLAVLRQDGRGLARLAGGLIQYGAVLACWVAVGAAVIAASAGLTKGILHALLGVNQFSGYAAGDGFVDQVSGTVEATTLGMVSLFVLIPASFGYLVIMLVRAAALLILAATLPITAAGALGEGSRSWMWKSLRWFLASALMAPLLALVLGLGAQLAQAGFPDGTESSAAAGDTFQVSSSATNVGMSVVGAVILLVGCFTPLVLFRLFAFVDPGTASGASFRSTLEANGGVAGLFSRKGGSSLSAAQEPGTGAAVQTDDDGRTTSEAGADAATSNRWQAKAVRVLPAVGGAVAGAMTATGKVAQYGAAMTVDVMGTSGVGNQAYYDTSRRHAPEPGGRRVQMEQPRAGRSDGSDNPDGSDVGVANDVPPAAAGGVEEGAMLL